MDEKRCCFIGHRTIEQTDELVAMLHDTIRRLIEEEGVRYFLFGSRSAFDDLCHSIVTELQKEHSQIVRVAYTRRSEYAVKAEEKARMEKSWSSLLKRDIKLKDYDAEVQSDKVFSAGRASYVERNQEMIDASDYCVFYYNEGYMPPCRKRSERDISTYQPKSGTRLAYEYAMQKAQKTGKVVINTYPASKN